MAAPYDDLDALSAFARSVAVVTFEFENVPSAATERHRGARAGAAVARGAARLAAPRAREEFLADRGFPTVPFARGHHARRSCTAALARIGTPAVVKTAASGYDGKGQQAAASAERRRRASGRRSARRRLVVEKRISLQAELSVVAARGLDGQVAQYPLFENRHRNHILDVTTAPAPVPAAVAAQAAEIAARHPRGARTTWACCASSSSSAPTAS